MRAFILTALSFSALLAADEKSPPYSAITAEQIAAITFDDVQNDDGWVAPVAKDLTNLAKSEKKLKSFNDWWAKVEAWPNGKSEDVAIKVASLVDVAALVDLDRGEYEAESAYSVFAKLTKEVPKDELIKATAWMVLKPEEPAVITTAPEIDIKGTVAEKKVRARAAVYAKKLLGRLEDKLPAKE